MMPTDSITLVSRPTVHVALRLLLLVDALLCWDHDKAKGASRDVRGKQQTTLGYGARTKYTCCLPYSSECMY
jgi:hypothetical protein